MNEAKEEEEMTNYKDSELDGWEFKIIRADTKRFKNRDMVEKVRMEEAKAGWELVEKFDDYRMRFKRRIEKRSMDSHLEIDPYRSRISMSKGSIIALIVAALTALVGALTLLGFRFGFDRGLVGGFTVPAIILAMIVVFGIIAGIIAIRRNI